MLIPKKKKVIKIIIIISGRIETDLENDVTNTNAERLASAIAKAQPMFDEDESNWTLSQQAVWQQVEHIADDIDEESDEEDFGSYADNLESVL